MDRVTRGLGGWQVGGSEESVSGETGWGRRGACYFR